MKRIGLTLLLLSGCYAADKRACFSGDEHLGLSPTGTVTVDGFSAQRSTADGMFHTDAGLVFDTAAGELLAIDPQTEACLNEGQIVSLTVLDPFSGVKSTVELTRP